MIKGDEVKPYLLSGPSVEVIPVPEASLVAFDEAYFAPCISEARLPHQGSVAEDPQTALLRNDVLRIPLHPGPRDAAEKTDQTGFPLLFIRSSFPTTTGD